MTYLSSGANLPAGAPVPAPPGMARPAGTGSVVSARCVLGHPLLDRRFESGDLVGVGELRAVGSADVEGVDHRRPEGGDLGRGHVEAAVDEGLGDPVELSDHVLGPDLDHAWPWRRRCCPP